MLCQYVLQALPLLANTQYKTKLPRRVRQGSIETLVKQQGGGFTVLSQEACVNQ